MFRILIALMLVIFAPSWAIAQPVSIAVGTTPIGGTPVQTNCLKVGAPINGSYNTLAQGDCVAGPAGGDLTGTYPNPTLAGTVSGGPHTASGASGGTPGWHSKLTTDTAARAALGLSASDVPYLGFGSGSQPQDVFLSRRSGGNLQLGGPDAAIAVPQTLTLQSVVAGTSNVEGGTFTIQGSASTGNQAGGSIVFQTVAAGSSGTTQNTPAPALTLNSLKQALFSGAIAEKGVTTSITAGRLAIDLSQGNYFNFTSNQNITDFDILNIPANQVVYFQIISTGNGTTYAQTWNSNFTIRTPGGAALSLTSTNGAQDVITFMTTDGGASFRAVSVLNFLSLP